MKFKILLVIMLLAAIGGGYYYYTQQQAAAEVQTYETAPVVRMNLMQTVSATGTVQPRDSVEVSSKITARIKEVLVKRLRYSTARTSKPKEIRRAFD